MAKPLILIVEDDPQLSQIYSITLQSEFEVQTADNGDTALSILAETDPLLVLLDLHLPGAKGKDILSYVRSTPRLANTHVFLATADAFQADFLRDAADIVLLKPISPTQLRDLVQRFLK